MNGSTTERNSTPPKCFGPANSIPHKVQTPSSEQTDRRLVQRHSRGPTRFRQPTPQKILLPFSAALVAVRQHYAMRPVADPVHESQRYLIQKIFNQMIL